MKIVCNCAENAEINCRRKIIFCYKCGHRIPDEAQFCSKCRTAQKSTVTQEIAKNNTSSSDFDREAIKIHLSDILALECMKIKLNTDYEESNDKLTYEQNNNYVERFSIPNGYVWLAYHDGKYHIGAFRGYGEGAYELGWERYYHNRYGNRGQKK